MDGQLVGRWFGFLSLGIVLTVNACGSSGNRSPDAGGGAGAGGGAAATGTGGVGGAGQICVLDSAATDWFTGVWTGLQGNETFTVTNRGGCTVWQGTVNGVLCDYCAGTYAVTGPTTGTATLACEPKASCSVSPIHTDTGTVTANGCTFVYDYTYSGVSGTGQSTYTGAIRVGDATADVCSP